ncbi:hypothetical protein QAD02_013565 [Eretmocerus hayati]|uniref:Uncharacterized protein n=1 Tax=Eretmocerus hayati TaxID=131215 RepID=A0ACC2P3V2_9HYME|nr:hypothetical protein QAD02_013565 [Eretmocerus hayati]
MRPVVWADAETLLKAVQEYRDELTDPKIKNMADSGQGFSKISPSIFEIRKNEAIDFDRKKCLYSEGGSSRRKNKLTSVKRLILLCVVPQVKESYENLKLLFELTNLNNISFKFIADSKVYLTCVGQQTASASYPSPICFIKLEDLKNRDVSDDVEHEMDHMEASESSKIEKIIQPEDQRAEESCAALFEVAILALRTMPFRLRLGQVQ